MQQRVACKIGPTVRKVEVVSLHLAMIERCIVKGNRLRITAEYSEHISIVARIPRRTEILGKLLQTLSVLLVTDKNLPHRNRVLRPIFRPTELTVKIVHLHLDTVILFQPR